MIDIGKFLVDLDTWIGVPFHHQGRSRYGIDCLGLILTNLTTQGINIQAPKDYPVNVRSDILLKSVRSCDLVYEVFSDELIAGDILVFRILNNPQHMAIVTSPDSMIHVDFVHGVCKVAISAIWRMRLVSVFRWVNK